MANTHIKILCQGVFQFIPKQITEYPQCSAPVINSIFYFAQHSKRPVFFLQNQRIPKISRNIEETVSIKIQKSKEIQNLVANCKNYW